MLFLILMTTKTIQLMQLFAILCVAQFCKNMFGTLQLELLQKTH